MSTTISIRATSAGASPRTCSGVYLGVRPKMGRLFLLTNPYGVCHPEGSPPVRLALVDDHDQTIYVWYCDTAHRWAQKLLVASDEREDTMDEGWEVTGDK